MKIYLIFYVGYCGEKLYAAYLDKNKAEERLKQLLNEDLMGTIFYIREVYDCYEDYTVY